VPASGESHLEALLSIARAASGSVELEAVLQHALEQVLRLFDFPSGTVRRLAPDTGELKPAAEAGLPPALRFELEHPLRVGEGPEGLAAERRALVVLDDLADSPDRASPWARHGYRTFASVPLQYKGMLLGCLSLATTRVRPLSEADRELLTALADQIGMAVANAELYAAAQRKIADLSALHQFSEDVGPVPDPDRVMRLTAERMAGLLHMERTAILDYLPETQELVAATSHGFGELLAGLRAELAVLPLAARVLRDFHPVISDDPAAEGLLPEEFVRRAGMRASMAVPLMAHHRVIGLLVGDNAGQPLRLSADEMELAVILANQASVWIDSARLFVREQTARAIAEAAEVRFRGLLESAPDSIVIVDAGGRIVLVNGQVERVFGYRREELLDQSVEVLLPARYRDAHHGHRTHYQAAPRTRPMGAGLDLLGRRKDGSEFPVEISLSPMQTEAGVVVTSVIRDITERKQAQDTLARQTQELARSNAELEQFAYVASHDLQEPLRMVSSYTQLIAKRYRGKIDADADEFIAYAVDGVNRMQQLINDLLAYSRVRTKGKEFERTDIGGVLAAVLANLRAAIEESGAAVTHGPLPTVMADPWQLTQLFQNLIGNAIKFRRDEPPRVHVVAEREGNDWVFSVRDNGIGIEPEYLDRIFLIFQRLHSRGEYPGTGIGLAICKQIVERHGGHIGVESQPQAGSTFYFTLPARGDVSP
jgi:PAS domain S-box-containing protein